MIQIQNISKRFGNHWALKKCSFEAQVGDIVAVLGQNGCGKSTLLRILATRIEPTFGEGTVLGHHLLKDKRKIRGQTEWLGHHFAVYPQLTASENLRFFLRLEGRAADSAAIAAVLDKAGLKSREGLAGSFSAGMQKRLALARILLKNPKILLLDEPHTNLDREGKEWMNRLIGEWSQNGATCFLASHDHEEVLPLATRVLHLKEGRLGP